MTLGEVIGVMSAPDLVQILKGEAEIYHGYLANFQYTPGYEQYKGLEVVKLTNNLDIKHKRYKELGLMPPLHPEQMPDYKFSDLQLTLYKVIVLKSEESEE